MLNTYIINWMVIKDDERQIQSVFVGFIGEFPEQKRHRCLHQMVGIPQIYQFMELFFENK